MRGPALAFNIGSLAKAEPDTRCTGRLAEARNRSPLAMSTATRRELSRGASSRREVLQVAANNHEASGTAVSIWLAVDTGLGDDPCLVGLHRKIRVLTPERGQLDPLLHTQRLR